MMMKQEDTPKTLGNLGSLGSHGLGRGHRRGAPVRRGSWATGHVLSVGIVVVVAGLMLLPVRQPARAGLPKGRKVQLRKRYWLYYTLSFLLGSRRHIFTTFAVLPARAKFGVSVQTIATAVPGQRHHQRGDAALDRPTGGQDRRARRP